MFPVGLSTCSKTTDERFFADCAAAGIRFLEISPRADAYDAVDWLCLRKNADAYGVQLRSFHLPFLPFETLDISALDPGIRRASVRRDTELLFRAADAGVGIFVIHPSGEPIADADRETRMAAAKESLSALCETAAECGGTLAVENLPRTCLGRDAGEITELLTADGRLRVCFDTNHLLRESHDAFLRKTGDKIVTTHVSDYDFIDEKHWLPGEGDVDWPALAAALYKTGYRGAWVYELGFGAPSTLRRPRDLTPEDFARNAAEIFEGGPLTVTGRRK